MLSAWLTPEGAKFIGGLVALCAYLWLLTKFEKKKSQADLDKEKADREIEFQNLWNSHILANVANRETEITTVGGKHFVLRTTYHDDVGDVDAKLQRILLDQATQGADIRNLREQLSALAGLVGQTNQKLSVISDNVANIAGIWAEHVRTHGGLSAIIPQRDH